MLSSCFLLGIYYRLCRINIYNKSNNSKANIEDIIFIMVASLCFFMIILILFFCLGMEVDWNPCFEKYIQAMRLFFCLEWLKQNL